jgi:chromosome segregation ATPase
MRGGKRVSALADEALRETAATTDDSNEKDNTVHLTPSGTVFLLGQISDNLRSLDTRLTGDIRSLDAKIDKLNTKLDDKVDKLDDRIDKLEQKLDDRIDKLEQRLDVKIDKLDMKFDDLDTKLSVRMDKLDGKLGRWEIAQMIVVILGFAGIIATLLVTLHR